jgi:hypothetical protein
VYSTGMGLTKGSNGREPRHFIVTERVSIFSRTDAYTEYEDLVRFSCVWRGRSLNSVEPEQVRLGVGAGCLTFLPHEARVVPGINQSEHGWLPGVNQSAHTSVTSLQNNMSALIFESRCK